MGPVEGLSPRVRGNLNTLLATGRLVGSIPACAGEPQVSTSGYLPPAVYPRVCGGTGRQQGVHPADTGLSPRVRGNPMTMVPQMQMAGSIPACAGEPQLVAHAIALVGVYPRVCGGTDKIGPRPSTFEGLSPRVRGNHLIARRRTQRERSIPACAGEPVPSIIGAGALGVYPRVCGGTAGSMVKGERGARSIPACAGEPPDAPAPARASAVYPRVCGGTPGQAGPPPHRLGLSPRVRGNPGAPATPARWLRSIPACAGEPMATARTPQGQRVYPRVCGGTTWRYCSTMNKCGLSPRVRGNP